MLTHDFYKPICYTAGDEISGSVEAQELYCTTHQAPLTIPYATTHDKGEAKASRHADTRKPEGSTYLYHGDW